MQYAPLPGFLLNTDELLVVSYKLDKLFYMAMSQGAQIWLLVNCHDIIAAWPQHGSDPALPLL